MRSARWWAAIATAALVLAAVAQSADARRRSRRSNSSKIATFTAEGLPNVQSATAIVLDADNGEILYAKNPDRIRYIASTGKIFAAMAVRRLGIDLEGLTEITKADASAALGGARTRLSVGHKFRNIDLLRAMLIASDNRAPTALARAVGLSPEGLVAEMNRVAASLGLTKTHFTDPSGLRGNSSTSREMAIALQALLKDDVLAEIVAAPTASVVSVADRPRRIDYRNTNRSLHSGRYEVFAGKTGFTDSAGYCLVIGAQINGRRLLMSFLGSTGKYTRFGDFGRVATWLIEKRGAETVTAAAR